MSLCHILDRNISYQTHFDIETIREKWDGFLPENHHLKSAELSVLQKSKPDDISFAYLLIERESKLIGVVYFQMINFNSKNYNHSILNISELKVVKRIILSQTADLLFCGNLFRIDFPGFYFSNSLDNELIFQVLKHFEQRNGLKIKFSAAIIKDVEGCFSDAELEESKFKSYENDMLMELPVSEKWTSFEDYLASLSKKYYQRAQKILEAGQKIETQNLTLDEIADNAYEIEKLYSNIVGKQKVRIGKLNGNYFVEMKKRFGDDFQMVGYYDEGKMIAFASYISSADNSLEVHYIGMDYSENDRYKLYFNILFDGIEKAIHQKVNNLKFGRTSYDAKASAGAVAKQSTHYFKVKRGLPSLIYKYLTNWYKEDENETWKIRNPFKSSPEPAKAFVHT